METRRSWLWRRKSSEKSPGETESSGSISSHSGRFSDEQAYSNPNAQSPEVTSKATSIDEEVADDLKSLTEKLSAALLDISAKEDLVKQHAKVAEEAVSGWEKAENEVSSVRHQLEAVTLKNTALEDRIGHLDGALKECVRQLRQAREEQEQKIQDAVAKQAHEWGSIKSKYETELGGLRAQLQNVKAETLTPSKRDPDLCANLEALEKENSALKLELLSRAEEIEIRIIERELSTQAAEAASKQHLESIKKVAKLEAECLKLKSIARKASLANDNKSPIASSVYVESFTDSQSDCGERLMVVEADSRKMSGLQPNEFQPGRIDSWASPISEHSQYRNDRASKRSPMVPSSEITLMDDFLEMERLVTLPDTDSGSFVTDIGAVLDQPNSGESQLKVELEAMIQRTAVLEEKLGRMEAEKVEMDIALTECQIQLQGSKSRLREAEARVVKLETQLDLAKESAQAAEDEVLAYKAKRDMAESQCRHAETEIENLRLKVNSLEEELVREKFFAESTNANREVAESQLKHFEAEIETFLAKVNLLEDEVKKEKSLAAENIVKCEKLECELSRFKENTELKHAASSNEERKMSQEKELALAANKFAECQKTIVSLGRQLKTLATLEDFLLDSEKSVEVR